MGIFGWECHRAHLRQRQRLLVAATRRRYIDSTRLPLQGSSARPGTAVETAGTCPSASAPHGSFPTLKMEEMYSSETSGSILSALRCISKHCNKVQLASECECVWCVQLELRTSEVNVSGHRDDAGVPVGCGWLESCTATDMVSPLAGPCPGGGGSWRISGQCSWSLQNLHLSLWGPCADRLLVVILVIQQRWTPPGSD